MIGDSIFALSNEEAGFLEDLSGQAWRQYFISGAQMTGGMVRTIPAQYTQAKNADRNIRTVVMDGGGNDVLIGGQTQCSTTGNTVSAACERILSDVMTVAEDLLEEMADDGVQNVVWQSYYHTTNASLDTVGDLATERLKAVFADFQARHPEMKAIYIDVRPSFTARPATYTVTDGIHPTTASSEKLANLVWNAMVNNNIEQTTSCSSSSSSSSGGCN
ncbi:MAG: SGNH/GDSL hydrolase family protein [Desulfobacterales bacterium]|nr:SGNH/GDSL hydrolase family protein [Desulfobacterales bacterium]